MFKEDWKRKNYMKTNNKFVIFVKEVLSYFKDERPKRKQKKKKNVKYKIEVCWFFVTISTNFNSVILFVTETASIVIPV